MQHFSVRRTENRAGVCRCFNFLCAVLGLHGEERTADLDHRQRQFTQHAQIGYRTRHRKIKRAAVVSGVILRTGMHRRNVGQAQFGDDFI